jgi:hypothetical protein
MAKGRRTEEKRHAARRRTAVFLDAQGNRTGDPAHVQRGEVVEYDDQSEPVTRTWLYVLEAEWPRLNGPGVLLIALALLLALWLLVAVVFLI